MRRKRSWRDEVLRPVLRCRCERKYVICLAIRNGHVSVDDVVAAHGIARAEVEAWLAAAAAGGMDALRLYPPRRRAAA